MKILQYVLTISQQFPKTHPKAGLPTHFVEGISAGNKIHTIRTNYAYWEKRVKKINRGEAILSVRSWTGKPYASNQEELFVFGRVGIEKLERDKMLGWFINGVDSDYTIKDFARNDGLSIEDFKAWFKGTDFTLPKAILHFTDFRYENQTIQL